MSPASGQVPSGEAGVAVVAAAVTYRRRRRPPVRALDGVTLEVAAGELVAVVGASGSGKSTLLRVVAGLATLDAGSVGIGGRDVTRLPPDERQVALVPQDLPLFPHLDVAANIAFGEAARRTPKAERSARVRDAVELLGLGALLDRPPASLSGGERQRVALARALVRRPAAFLLDEPLSGLDGATRLSLRADIRRLQRSTGTAMLYVTHDPQEAMAIGDRVAVLAGGRVHQLGTPLELYARPASVVVARLMGPLPMNLLDLGGSDTGVGGESQRPAASGATTLGVRPERVRLVPAGSGRLDAVVTEVELIGAVWLVRLLADGAEVLAEAVDHPPVGRTIGVAWEAADEHHFDASGQRLATVPLDQTG